MLRARFCVFTCVYLQTCVYVCAFGGEQAFNEHLGQNTGDLTFYKVLIRWGADVNARDPSGDRPLDYATKIKFVTTSASERSDWEIKEETPIEFATMLIQAGADPALCKTDEQDWRDTIEAAKAAVAQGPKRPKRSKAD